MHDVSIDPDLLTLVPMYIAVAPRDPRGERRLSDEAIRHVPAATVEEGSDVLVQLGVPAEAIDGAVLGAPGWVVARTVGWNDGRVLRWAPDENPVRGPFPTLPGEDVATYLSRAIDVECLVGEDFDIPAETPGAEEIGLVIESRCGAVVSAGLRSTDAPHLAHLTQESLWFAQVDGVSVVAGVDPSADLADVAAYTSSTPTLGLERHGPWRRLGVVRDGEVVAAHEWGPAWSRVDPSAGQAPDAEVFSLVFDRFEPPQAGTGAIVEAFGLGQVEAVALDRLLRAPDADDPFTTVLRILGLPEEAAEVAEGWLNAAELPGARRVEPQPFARTVWSTLTTDPTEPGRLNDLQRLWIHRPAIYWVLSAAELALSVAAAAVLLRRPGTTTGGATADAGRGAHLVRRAAGWAGVVAAVVTAADMAVPRRMRGLDPR